MTVHRSRILLPPVTNPGGRWDPVNESTGDPLDRYYTPQLLATAIVEQLLLPLLPDAIQLSVLEPHAGGGAFINAIQRSLGSRAVVQANDTDPEAPALLMRMADSQSVGPFTRSRWSPRDVIVGNPPWDPEAPADPTIAHVQLAIRTARHVILVLPWSYGGQPSWNSVLWDSPRFVGIAPIHPRPWLNHREAAAFVWSVDGHESNR